MCLCFHGRGGEEADPLWRKKYQRCNGCKGKLKRNIEEGVRSENQNDKSGESKVVPEILFTIHQDGAQEDDRHDRCSDDRNTGTRNQRIKDHNDNRKSSGSSFNVPSQEKIFGIKTKSCHKKGKDRDHCDIESGYGDDMGGSGTVEFLHDFLWYFLLIPENHRLNDPSFYSRGTTQNGLPDTVTKPFQVFLQRISLITAQDDKLGGVSNGSSQQYFLKPQMGLVVKASGIMEVTGRMETCLETDDISIMKRIIFVDGQ